MESELDVEIFNRNSRGAFLTEQGEAVVQKFEKMLAIYDGIKGDAQPKRQPQGKLCILSDINIWTSYDRLYRDFTKAFPELKLAVEMMATEDILTQLQQRACIGLISSIVYEDGADLSLPQDVEFLPVAKDRVMVYGAQDNPYLSKYKTISLATLAKLPLINFKPYNHGQTLTERLFAHVGTPNIRYEVADIRVFYELAAQTDVLFLTFRRPKYAAGGAFRELQLRDKIYFESGVAKKQAAQNALHDLFTQYYLDYYGKLYS